MIPGADRDSTPWWEALGRRELVQQRCDDCGRWRWPPRAMCGECASLAWSWQPVSGQGKVVSHIRTHHSFLPGIEAPYTTVLVALAEQEDVVLVGFWGGDAEPAIGDAVRVAFVERDGEILLGWAPG